MFPSTSGRPHCPLADRTSTSTSKQRWTVSTPTPSLMTARWWRSSPANATEHRRAGRSGLSASDLLEDIVESAPGDLDVAERLIGRLEVDRFTREPLLALVAELRQLRGARPSPTGHVGRYTHTCASCGRELKSNRRQLPDHKSWCGRPECRKVAATERARAYRGR